MTDQEIYDTVVNHLRKQDQRAIGERQHFNHRKQVSFTSQECMYRTSDGLKCAAGCLIPDEDYDPKFEYEPMSNEYSSVGKYFAERFTPEQVTLIGSLQIVHDQRPLNQWEQSFQECADHFGLGYTLPS